jgi:2,3-dimethylmalate lyase
VPLLFNWAEGGKTPPMPLERLRELGYRLVIFPIGALLVAAKAVRTLLADIKAHGAPVDLFSDRTCFQEFNDRMGLSEIQQLEKRFAAKSGAPRDAPKK